MKRLLASIGCLVFGLGLSCSATAAQPLLTPQELQSRLASPQLRVIDIRESKIYLQNHLPGALNAPYMLWRGPSSNPGELPALDKLTGLVQNLGLTPSTPVVVVSSGADASDFGASARVYWTLKLLGLKELSVLNGGVKAWVQAGLPQEKAESMAQTSSYQPQIDSGLLATKVQIKQQLNKGDVTLVDARPADFFNGETRAAAAKVPGTLPGAVDLPFSKWFTPGSALFVPLDQARQVAASSPLPSGKETVSFCNTGHWAATNWFAMSEVLGQKNVKLYAGSMVEWSQDVSGLPMDNVPGRLQQLLIDAKIWSAKTLP
jgi:thiosulfate/3-mercaptopyruvate sulfurtransferase